MEDFYLDGHKEHEFLERLFMKTKTYRQLTADELKQYGINVATEKTASLHKLYNDYFDKSVEPTKALIIVNSEYDDCDYNNRVNRIIFYDENDNELVPLKSKSRQYHSLDSYKYNISIEDTTREQLEDEIVFMKIPTLYVEE